MASAGNTQFNIEDYVGEAAAPPVYNPLAHVSVLAAGIGSKGSVVKELEKCKIYTAPYTSQVVFPIEGTLKFPVELKAMVEGMDPMYTLKLTTSAVNVQDAHASLAAVIGQLASKLDAGEITANTTMFNPEYNEFSIMMRDVWSMGARTYKPIIKSHLGSSIKITDLDAGMKLRIVMKMESFMTYTKDGVKVGKLVMRPTLISVVEEFAPPDFLMDQCTRGATPIKMAKGKTPKKRVASSKPKAPRKPAAKKVKKESETQVHARESKEEDEANAEEEESGEEVEE